jgi:hypothetical protein
MSNQFTTADIGKILGFPLLQHDGTANTFTGATAKLMVRDQNGSLQAGRPMSWNASTNQWEYSVQLNDFSAGRYWGMVAVAFSADVTIYSTEVVFDVTAAD